MRHTFRPATPFSSIVTVSLCALGFVLATDDSLPLPAAARAFFVMLAPLALYHLRQVAASLQFFELTTEGLVAHGLLRRRLLRFGKMESASFSRLTGDFVLRGGGYRLSIPVSCARFADLHFALLTGRWAHRRQEMPEPASSFVLRPSLGERAHAAYAVAAPMVWAGCLSWAYVGASPLFLIAGALQATMNFHGLSHLLNWYEIRADGLVIHALWRRQFLPASEFLTSLVREDAEGRALELAFYKQTIRVRFAFPLPAEELAGILNRRWTAQASY
ncbi:MAG: hypothetical protein K2X03_10195 [Bryobacteraceae bacterium]|nr:hypothetical protein [Bryobacteraceae bacterium]